MMLGFLSLLTFNNLSFNSKFVNALFRKKQLALVGGLLFEQNNIIITLSCCANFQDWKTVVNDIQKRVSLWIGHNPSSWIEFKEQSFTVWSDEKRADNLVCIQLTYSEFNRQLILAKKELNCFLKIVAIWAKK